MTDVAAEADCAIPGSEQLALRRGLNVIPFRGALLVDGGLRRHLLKGDAVAAILSVLPTLLPLLDGGHDRTGICAETGLDAMVLDEFFRLLAECEALEPVRCGRPRLATPAAGQVATFLSRTVRAADGYRSGADLMAVLEQSSALIVAPTAISEQIAADLAETGVGSVTVADSPVQLSAASLRAASSAARKVAVVFDGWPASGGPNDLAEVISRCRPHGIAVLRFGCGTGAEIGPIFGAGASVCADCFRRGHDAMAGTGSEDAGERVLLANSLAADGVLAGLVSAEVLALICDPTDRARHRTLSRMPLPGYQAERYDLVPEPGCRRCGDWRSSDDAVTIAEDYEWLERIDPLGEPSRRTAYRSPETQGNAGRRARLGDLVLGPRTALPGSQTGPAAEPLSGLLGQLAGWRPAAAAGAAGRLDPSDGEVASVHAYLFTDATLTDLPATIFRYDHHAGELVGTRADLIPLAHALRSTDLAPEALDFAVVLVAAAGQLRRGYGTSALRLSHLDVGCVATQLSAAAASLGRQLSFASSWSTELADLLELDPDDEIVAAVAGIHRLPEAAASCR